MKKGRSMPKGNRESKRIHEIRHLMQRMLEGPEPVALVIYASVPGANQGKIRVAVYGPHGELEPLSRYGHAQLLEMLRSAAPQLERDPDGQGREGSR